MSDCFLNNLWLNKLRHIFLSDTDVIGDNNNIFKKYELLYLHTFPVVIVLWIFEF